MSHHCQFSNPRVDQIRALNDQFRQTLTGGSVVVTQAVASLGSDLLEQIMAALALYDDFDADNDPYGEHDFGLITIDTAEILFKIDYYNKDRQMASPDPADPALTHRVLTIMLAEDY